ncbi:MAG: glucose-6-phosphate isomerase family protein [bacterium]|nr:glucose-6-phosphate isomerase family protein [bacterium]
MAAIMEPFKSEIHFQSGVFSPAQVVLRRTISQTHSLYADAKAAQHILASEPDRLIYEVYTTDLPEEEGHILHCTTVIYPGRVGEEYHMTKGHFHARREQGEVYLGLAGRGYLLMQTAEGDVRALSMETGTAAYVPPYWAHRTVNVGDEPFIFFAAWAGEAGHDYVTIEQHGFRKLIVHRNGQAELADNPRYG